MDPWIAGSFTLGGVVVGSAVQAALLWVKHITDSKGLIRERKVLFAADVSQYLQYVRDVEYTEGRNTAKGTPVPLTEAQRNDLSARHRAVRASAYSLMACGDELLAVRAELFMRTFGVYVDTLREITTGQRGLPYESQHKVEEALESIRVHKPSLRPRKGQIKRLNSTSE